MHSFSVIMEFHSQPERMITYKTHTHNMTRALRAHTTRVPCIYIIVQLGHRLWTTFTYTYEASVHEQKFMHNA